MTKHRILQLRPVASCCSSLVQKHHRSTRIASLGWAAPTERPLLLLPPSVTRPFLTFGGDRASSFSTVTGETNPIPNTLVKFTDARLAYPDDCSENKSSTTIAAEATASSTRTGLETPPLPRSQLVLDDFSISLPNLTTNTTTTDPNEELRGGIAIVGRNGSGKTLLGKAILAEAASSVKGRENPYVASGSLEIVRDNNSKPAIDMENRHLRGRAGSAVPRGTSGATVTHVSFDSHKQLLEEKDERTGNTVTAFKTIAMRGNAPGRLNPAARFLVVRFGLYPLLHRTVDTLSTGEIRKVLLVRALSQKPRLLLLDNAFDGLDVPSRKVLQEIISKTLRGFSNDLLVQGVSSKDTADSTQVILMTHRAEELDEIRELDTVAWWGPDRSGETNYRNDTTTHSWRVLRRRNMGSGVFGGSNVRDTVYCGHYSGGKRANDESWCWASGNEVLHRAMGSNVARLDWGDSSNLPHRDSVKKWWMFDETTKRNNGIETNNDDETIRLVAFESGVDEDVLVEAKDLTVRRGDATLLKSLSWTVRKGERWIVGGGNGAGKSTLSRLLALSPTGGDGSEKQSKNDAGSWLRILPNCNPCDPRTVVGWVSTESHMQQQQQQQQQQQPSDDEKPYNPTTREFLLNATNSACWENVILPVLDWLGIANHDPQSAATTRGSCAHIDDSSLSTCTCTCTCSIAFDRPFHRLSQGEQKLIMIAAAVALRPPLLVLDEPCQGLDPIHRTRLLRAVEGICRSTDMALIYITHHLEEERMPSISNALHLKDRRAVYNGCILEYSPDDYNEDKD